MFAGEANAHLGQHEHDSTASYSLAKLELQRAHIEGHIARNCGRCHMEELVGGSLVQNTQTHTHKYVAVPC